MAQPIAMRAVVARAALVQAEPDLELLVPVATNIVCFRYAPPGCEEEDVRRLNVEIMLRLQETGVAALSDTTIHGKHCLATSHASSSSSPCSRSATPPMRSCC